MFPVWEPFSWTVVQFLVMFLTKSSQVGVLTVDSEFTGELLASFSSLKTRISWAKSCDVSFTGETPLH